MNDITPTQRRALRATAHHLNPVASIGQHGLTPSVLKEIDGALNTHELIKVKLHGADRDAREVVLAEICAALGCAAIQHIGSILILWREKPEVVETEETPRLHHAPLVKPRKRQGASITQHPRREKVVRPIRSKTGSKHSGGKNSR